MDSILVVLFGLLLLIGASATALSRDPFTKLIGLGILVGGVMPFLADRGYLDVLAATALIAPLSTVFILMVCRRGVE